MDLPVNHFKRAIQAGRPPDQIPFAEPRDTRKLTRDQRRKARALSKDPGPPVDPKT